MFAATRCGLMTSGRKLIDVSGATYASKSVSVAAQGTTPTSVSFSSDGTKMYFGDVDNRVVYQYALSTAWDVSTATYASKNKSLLGQDAAAPTGFALSDDGTKFYAIGTANLTVYQYTLSTAWDIRTAAYASKSKLVSAQVSNPRGIAFSPDGTQLFVVSSAGAVYQYTLSTAWDVSTATYASKSKSVTSEGSGPYGIAFADQGSSMLVVMATTVYQYSLSVQWDLSTATYSGKSKLLSSQDSSPNGISVSADLTKLYVSGNTNNSIFQYTLG